MIYHLKECSKSYHKNGRMKWKESRTSVLMAINAERSQEMSV
jgi:hypothetical protein